MDTARSEGSRIILAWDFNVHNRQWLNSTRTTVAGEYAEDMCILHGLEQHVTMPARGNNTLDLIMSDFPLRVTVTTQPPLGASDHVVLIADFPTLVPKEPLTHRTVWRYRIRQIALVNTLLLSAASTRTTSLTSISLPHDSVHRGSSATFTSARLQYSANYSDSSPPRQLAPTTSLPEFWRPVLTCYAPLCPNSSPCVLRKVDNQLYGKLQE